MKTTAIKNAKRFAMPGMIFTVIISAAESNNSMVLAEYEALPGSEPPRHVHSNEDEVFMLKQGTMTFYIGDKIVYSKPGDTVYLPVNVPHHFVITSPVVKATVMATPGDIEYFFRSVCVPFEGDEIPPCAISTNEEMEYFAKESHKYGVRYLQ